MVTGGRRWVWALAALAGLACPGSPALAGGDRSGPGLEEVIVVSKTHFDIGFTDLASRVVDRYRTAMADQTLKLVDESRGLPPDRRFSWTLAGWPMAQVLWPGQDPARRDRFLAAMRDGRLVPHALAFTTHTESLDLEDLVRGFRYSVELSKQAGKPLPTAAKMTDVMSHARATATVLARAGVTFFIIGCNEGCSRPDLPLLYWWEGPDRSRVLTMCTASYGSSLTPPPGWPHKAWLYMWMTGDNHGPPSAEEVKDLFARAGRELPGVRIRFGQMSDFADAILREKPDLPVVRGDTPDTWIHGIGSMPVETQLAHATRPRIAALEALDTLRGAWSLPGKSAAGIVRDSYEDTLLFGEHTWGPDVGRYAGYTYGDAWKKRLAAGDYRFLLEGFDQKRAYARRAAERVEPALAERMTALAGAVDVEGPRVVAFNPLAWTRDAVAEVPWTADAPELVDLATGLPVPSAVEAGRLRFVAKGLPPLGYRTYRALPATSPRAAVARTGEQAIENRHFRVTLDPARCGIRSIIDKRTGRELVNQDSPHSLGQYLYERFDAAQNARFTAAYVRAPQSGEMISHGKPNLPSAKEQPYRAEGATAATVTIRSDAASTTAVLRAAPRGIIPDATSLSVRLHDDLPWIDLEWSIARKTPDPWPEGGWLCFPLRGESPRFRLARLGDVVDPAADLIPGSNNELFCLNGGLTVASAAGPEVGICPIDSQLVSLGHPGLWRYTRTFEPRTPDVYVNLFNNVYSTNFAQWIDGSWSSRVRLWVPEAPVPGRDDLIARSWEARSGCMAAVATGGAGTRPPLAAGLTLTRGKADGDAPSSAGAEPYCGVIATAFGPNPYGEGILLRLWEQSGTGGPCLVRLPRELGVKAARPHDLRGQPIGPPLPVSEAGTFTVTLEPMAPTTLVLETR